MDVERILTRAYQEWRKAYAFYIAFGILGALLALTITYPFIGTPWEVAAGVLAGAIAFTFFASIAWNGRNGDYTFSGLMRTWAGRFVHVASTYLLVILSLVTGALLANVMVSLALDGAVGADVAAALILAIFLYVAIRFSLAPFYALKYDWQEAVGRSLEKTGKHFIGVLVVELFIAAIHVVLFLFGPPVYLLAYTFFLVHFTNLALIETAFSRG